MSFQQTVSRIGKKDWSILLNLWSDFLPKIEFPIVDAPPPTSEIPSLEAAKERIIQIEKNSTIKDHHFTIPGLHVLIFVEAVYLFYKFLNVLKSAQSNTLNGFKTWSVATAYQASYFGLKCFLDIVGIHSTRVANRDILIDLYPSYSGLTRKEAKRRRDDYEIQIQLTGQLVHYEYWQIFQRILRISRNLPLEERLVRFLASLEPTVFARQRNSIIYYNTQWLFTDLKEALIHPDFAVKKIMDEEDVIYDTEDDAFTTINAFLLLYLCYSLFREIARTNPNFAQEFDVLTLCMDDDKNALYHRFVDLQF